MNKNCFMQVLANTLPKIPYILVYAFFLCERMVCKSKELVKLCVPHIDSHDIIVVFVLLVSYDCYKVCEKICEKIILFSKLMHHVM